MERRYWITATGIVLFALLFLIWDPSSVTEEPVQDAARATIVELGADAEPSAITTIQLQTQRAETGSGQNVFGAGSELIARFESERVDPSWAQISAARLTAVLSDPLSESEGTIHTLECRATACRLTVEFPQASVRAEGVAALMEHLREESMPALIERADRTRAVILVAP